MNNYWPPKIKASTTSTFLWQHEWETHGQDYAAIIYKLRPGEFTGTDQQRNDKLQVAFFTETIAFYKKYRVQKLSAAAYTKANLAAALGVSENQIAFGQQFSEGTLYLLLNYQKWNCSKSLHKIDFHLFRGRSSDTICGLEG